MFKSQNSRMQEHRGKEGGGVLPHFSPLAQASSSSFNLFTVFAVRELLSVLYVAVPDGFFLFHSFEGQQISVSEFLEQRAQSVTDKRFHLGRRKILLPALYRPSPGNLHDHYGAG